VDADITFHSDHLFLPEAKKALGGKNNTDLPIGMNPFGNPASRAAPAFLLGIELFFPGPGRDRNFDLRKGIPEMGQQNRLFVSFPTADKAP
jgi:hypothetical protein